MDNKDKSAKGHNENTVQRLDELNAQPEDSTAPEGAEERADVVEVPTPESTPARSTRSTRSKSKGKGKASSVAKKPDTPAEPVTEPQAGIVTETGDSENTDTGEATEKAVEADAMPAAEKTATVEEPSAAKAEPAAVAEPADKPAPAEPVAPVQAVAPAQKSGRGLAVFAILLVLLLAGAGYYAWLTLQKQWQQQLGNIDDKHQQQVAELNQEHQSQHQRLVQQLADSRNQSTQLERLTAQQGRNLEIMSDKLSQLAGRRPNDWLLAEANYLVTLAGRKLWLERDQQTALSLLATADSRIAEMHEANLVPLRQAFARDIAALQAMPADKSESLALRIDGLISQVDNLKLNMVEQPKGEAPGDETALSESVSDWRANLQKSWLAISESFITVRRHSGGIEPLMAPEQQWYLEENLKTKLLQAQLAIYREQQDAYEHAIDQISRWLMQFYDRQHSTTEFMLRELAELQQAKIVHQYPDAFETTDLLQQIIAQRGNTLPGSQEPSS